MAKKQQKRPQPLPDPSSSSSDSEEQQQQQPPSAAEEEEDQVSSEEEEEEEEHQPQPKPEESDSDSEQPPLAHRSPAKRAAENNADPKRAKNKKIKTVVVGVDAGGDSEAKKPFQRVWSVEDETAILKGLAEFISKTGNDPLKHGDAFYDFMKNSLQLDSNTKHLMQKVRRLKYKFHTHVAKGFNGECDGPNFPKAHFDLCMKIWGSTEAKPKANAKSKPKSTEAEAEEIPNSNSNGRDDVPSSSAKNSKSDNQVVVETDVKRSLLLKSVMNGYENLGVKNLNEDVVNKGLELIGASKRAELEARWSKLQFEELELVAKRAQLIHDQSRIILEAYKSSNN